MANGPTSVWFSWWGRELASAGRRLGFVAPSFRSPPAIAGVDRTVRRRPDGGVAVAVRLRERSLAAIRADMIEGVIAANQLTGPAADDLRRTLASLLPAPEQAA